MNAAGETKWHLSIKGQSYGPLTTARCYELIDASLLGPQDLVWDEASKKWVHAQEIFDFGTPPSPASQPARPQAGQPAAAQTSVPKPRAAFQQNPAAKPVAGDRKSPWYRDSNIIIGVLSLLATVAIGLVSVPFLSDYWQQKFVGGPLDSYSKAEASAFLSAYEGEWCADAGVTPGVPQRVRISRDGSKVKFVFGNIVAPMAISGRTTPAEPQFVVTNEGTSKRLLTDGKLAYFVEFEEEIFPGIVTYEQLNRSGARNLWRRNYIRDGKSEVIFQAELKRCP